MKRRLVLIGIILTALLGLRFSAPPLAQENAPPPEGSAIVAPEQPTASPYAPRGVATGVNPQIHDLSPWRMFQTADIVVQAVMVGLAFASLVTWTVFLAKSIELMIAKRRLRRAIDDLHRAGSLAEARGLESIRNTVVEYLIVGAEDELTLSGDLIDAEAIKERVASTFSEIVKTDTTAIRRGTGLLATIGSTAPFVGLFGTVWGIMNAFIGISKSQTTNLAVVAPGIAEALLATAIGLIAAIPAVIIYNHFTRGTRAYVSLVGRASGTILRLLSRETERRVRPSAFTRARA
jgi:biopolymer transport protein ExbB